MLAANVAEFKASNIAEIRSRDGAVGAYESETVRKHIAKSHEPLI